MSMHATALASTVTLMEITGQASFLNTTYYEPFIIYLAAAVIYLFLNFLLVLGFKKLEGKFLAHLKPQLA